MPIPDPQPNGKPPVNPDEFEMNLEPVDPAELNLGDAPFVEAVERRRPGFGFWMGLVWCIVFLCATQIAPSMLLMLIYGSALSDRMKQINAETRDDPSKPADLESILQKVIDSPEMRRMMQVALIAAPACGILFSLFFIRRVVGRDWRRRLAVRLPHVEHVVLLLLLFFPLFVFNVAFEMFSNRLPRWVDQFNLQGTKELMQSMATWPAWVVTLGIAIGPAISEEFFCRGFLGHGLVRRFGARGGILLTSLFFGLIHLSLVQSFFAIGMGIILHSVYLATRSLWIPILLHFLNNFFAMPGDAESYRNQLGMSMQQAFEFRPKLMLFASAVMFAAAAWAIWVSRVRILTKDGRELLYARHIELPPQSSSHRAIIGPIPALAVIALVATTGFFAAVWSGI